MSVPDIQPKKAQNHELTNNISDKSNFLLAVKNWLYHNPIGKTFTFFFSVIVSGILCGAFVNESTVAGKFTLQDFYEKKSFYLILGYLVLIIIYHYWLFKEDKKITNFGDKAYCIAYLNSRLLPAVADKAIEDIRAGREVDGFSNIQEFLERMD